MFSDKHYKMGKGMKMEITTGGTSATATLMNTPTAQAIWEALPIKGISQLCGNEICFSIPVDVVGEPEARGEVNIGDLRYWPPRHTFCIFTVVLRPAPESSPLPRAR